MIKEKQLRKNSQKAVSQIAKAFDKIVIHECKICGRFLGEKEFTLGEGICYEHWDK